jgi:aminoglycoside phosphotransferase (APT) family kinase protein
LNEILRKTAVGLAELHRSNVNIGQPVTWADELAEVQEQVRQLAAVFPHLKPAADLFLERLCQLEAETPAGPLVPSHGTFRPAQVLLYKGEISFIDFDSFCQSEPARDLAFFLSTLRMIGLTPSSFDHGKDPAQTIANEATWQARFAFLSSICDRFLEVYEQHHPVSRQRVALWEALNLFYTAMRGWAKVKVDETAYLVKLLDNFSRRLFSQR